MRVGPKQFAVGRAARLLRLQAGLRWRELLKTPDCAGAEAGLAHLPAVEDVAGLTGEQRGVEIGVGLPLDVGRRVGRKGAAGDVEGGLCRGHSGHYPQNRPMGQ